MTEDSLIEESKKVVSALEAFSKESNVPLRTVLRKFVDASTIYSNINECFASATSKSRKFIFSGAKLKDSLEITSVSIFEQDYLKEVYQKYSFSNFICSKELYIDVKRKFIYSI